MKTIKQTLEKVGMEMFGRDEYDEPHSIYDREIKFDLFPSMQKLAEDFSEKFLNKDRWNGIEEVIVTTSPTKHLNKEVLVPQIPRDAEVKTMEEFLNLPCLKVTTEEIETPKKVDIIVCRHEATIKMLQNIFGSEVPVLTGNVSEKDVENKVVAGVLPPHLISKANSLTTFIIKDYDRNEDGDMDEGEIILRGFEMKTIKMSVR